MVVICLVEVGLANIGERALAEATYWALLGFTCTIRFIGRKAHDLELGYAGGGFDLGRSEVRIACVYSSNRVGMGAEGVEFKFCRQIPPSYTMGSEKRAVLSGAMRLYARCSTIRVGGQKCGGI